MLVPQMARMIQSELANADLSQGIDPVMERLNTQLVKGSGGKELSAQDRKILQASLLNFFGAAMTGLDPKKFFDTFEPLSKVSRSWRKCSAKYSAAKFMDLLKQAEHFSENFDRIVEHAPGALDRKWSIFGEGFAFEWQRASAAVDNFMNSIGGSGDPRRFGRAIKVDRRHVRSWLKRLTLSRTLSCCVLRDCKCGGAGADGLHDQRNAGGP